MTSDKPISAEIKPVATINEHEGLTSVITKAEGDAHGLRYDYVAAWITLRVHSALAAVGLTAKVAQALAELNISCNVVAGFYHDHLFVPYSEAEKALTALKEMSSASSK